MPAAPAGDLPAMTDRETEALRRENDYLKLRNAQLQRDVTDLGAEAARLRQALERLSPAARAAG
jgi:cell division protein FtsB